MDNNYPNVKKSIYTKPFAIRIEEQLKLDIEAIKDAKIKDINEAFRIAMRQIVNDLKPFAKKEAS